MDGQPACVLLSSLYIEIIYINMFCGGCHNTICLRFFYKIIRAPYTQRSLASIAIYFRYDESKLPPII